MQLFDRSRIVRQNCSTSLLAYRDAFQVSRDQSNVIPGTLSHLEAANASQTPSKSNPSSSAYFEHFLEEISSTLDLKKLTTASPKCGRSTRLNENREPEPQPHLCFPATSRPTQSLATRVLLTQDTYTCRTKIPSLTKIDASGTSCMRSL